MAVVHALPGRWETLLRPGLMIPYDKGALAHVHARAHALAPLLLQLPLPLPLLSLLISHSIAPLNLKLPRPLSRPFPCPPRSVEQLMLDLVLKNVKQTQQNNKQSKTHRFAPRFYLPSPTLGPLPAVLRCDSKGTENVR